MYLSSIQKPIIYNYNNVSQPKVFAQDKNEPFKNARQVSSAQIPYDFKFNNHISFGSFFDRRRTVNDVDFKEYKVMSDSAKTRFRMRYEKFPSSSRNREEFVDKKYMTMPLRTERLMDEFLKTSSIYNKYKDHSIICLGRSPKWFLNAALWMKDGIPDYKFVAFSKYWYIPDPVEGMRKVPKIAPTEPEEYSYELYLKRIGRRPSDIVDICKKTGKKVVITDYICSGKGACSFLDVMSRIAEKQGVLEEFANSIQIVGIGCMEYMEELDPTAEYISTPRVPMPPLLRPYNNIIKQEFYDMDYSMFIEMLINQNTNECRSTYYPHEAWPIYSPDRYKAGMFKDLERVKRRVQSEKFANRPDFTPTMADFRNLLNFRILDALDQRKMLKDYYEPKM